MPQPHPSHPTLAAFGVDAAAVQAATRAAIERHGLLPVARATGLQVETVARAAAGCRGHAATLIVLASALGLVKSPTLPMAICAAPLPSDHIA